MHGWIVTRSKEIHIKSSKIIINKATVHRKESHQRNHISHIGQYFKHTILLQFLSIFNCVNPKCKYHSPMDNITKHDTKEKWKCDSCEYTWVDLLVARDSISVCYLLCDFCVTVCGECCWWELEGSFMEGRGWIYAIN